MSSAAATAEAADLDCQSCGACCSYSRDWPRLTLEDADAIARIPSGLLDDDSGTIRCEGDRCAALEGTVGRSTSCAIYAVRPDVCRACMPGDEACRIARQHFALS